MPHDTITPQQQLAYEGLLHIQSLNKPPMTPRQAVDACRKFSDKHTFIASCMIGHHVSTYGTHTDCEDYSITVFDGMTDVFRAANKFGFEKLVESVERHFFPFRKREDNDEDRFAQ